MIRCALAESLRPLTSTPRARRSSISPHRTAGSTTTPLPITQVLPGYRMPDGMRWNFHVSPAWMIVCPALLPPWKRTTTSARSASRSMTLPLPSSPHWAPTITVPGMSWGSVGGWALGPVPGDRRRDRIGFLDDPEGLAAQVGARDGQHLAHLLQAGHGALVDLLGELVALQVGGDDHRALLLVAGVDHRVELLEHPRAGLLGADVVDVQQVDAGQPVQQLGVGVLA